MVIYLDNCMFNRPFDDQRFLRIRLETEAKLFIQSQIRNNHLKLLWSYILEFENQQNPFLERKQSIAKWKKFASKDIEETPALLQRAYSFTNLGIKSKDALHVACAIEGNTDYFLTTDDKLLKKLLKIKQINALSPTEFIKVFESYDD